MMLTTFSQRLRPLIAGSIVVLAFAAAARAQSTTLTYQGRLTDGGVAANGVYDLQLRLFDALVGGNQIGSTIISQDVQVTNGIFNVTLDFGATAFSGAGRFLEVSVRPGLSTGAFTPLTPLQPFTSTPYAMRSLSAATADSLAASCVGCVGTPRLADGSVTNAKVADVAGSKITGTIPIAGVPAGSPNYIQNGTTQQASASFNIGGNATVGGNVTASNVTAAVTVTATAFNYSSPQPSYYIVNEAAFTSRDGTPVFKSFGIGGAYPNANTPWGLVAPINLPDGATVTGVRYVYVDNSPSNSLTLAVLVHFPLGSYQFLGEHTSSVNTGTIQVVDIPVNFTVDNSSFSWEVVVFPTTPWGDSTMMVREVRVTYTLPRPAR